MYCGLCGKCGGVVCVCFIYLKSIQGFLGQIYVAHSKVKDAFYNDENRAENLANCMLDHVTCFSI